MGGKGTKLHQKKYRYKDIEGNGCKDRENRMTKVREDRDMDVKDLEKNKITKTERGEREHY